MVEGFWGRRWGGVRRRGRGVGAVGLGGGVRGWGWGGEGCVVVGWDGMGWDGMLVVCVMVKAFAGLGLRVLNHLK